MMKEPGKFHLFKFIICQYDKIIECILILSLVMKSDFNALMNEWCVLMIQRKSDNNKLNRRI